MPTLEQQNRAVEVMREYLSAPKNEDPDVFAQEIADDLQTALGQFTATARDLGE